MPFEVLKIGNGARMPIMRYAVNPKKTHIRITIPAEDARAAKLKAGDLAQFSVGNGAESGYFGIGRGKLNARKLNATGSGSQDGALAFTIPYLAPLPKTFVATAGVLRVKNIADGAIVFSLA